MEAVPCSEAESATQPDTDGHDRDSPKMVDDGVHDPRPYIRQILFFF